MVAGWGAGDKGRVVQNVLDPNGVLLGEVGADYPLLAKTSY